MENHPCLELVPEMPEGLFQRLKEDISGLGVILPIVLVDGKIINGRARYRACQELGIECPVSLLDGMSPADCVRSMNFLRRHLSEDQQEEVRQRLVELIY